MHPILQSVAARRLGVFTSREALAAGYVVDDIKAALRSGRWVRLRKGVYTTRECLAAADERERHLLDCVAALLSLDPGPVLSHASAARLHGLVVPREVGHDVRVTDVEQWRRGRGYRVARAALPPGDVVPWLTFGATSVARTIVDCAREWSQLQAVVAMDAALQKRLVCRADLAEAVHSARHRAGASDAARALGLSDGRAESPLETEGRLALLAAGLPAPELQVELHDARGFVARVDAWYEERRPGAGVRRPREVPGSPGRAFGRGRALAGEAPRGPGPRAGRPVRPCGEGGHGRPVAGPRVPHQGLARHARTRGLVGSPSSVVRSRARTPTPPDNRLLAQLVGSWLSIDREPGPLNDQVT